jgi:hypothetical protein
VEVAAIKEMVLAPEHRHMPVGTLAVYAQRLGKVFASVTTWSKLIREHGWHPPRKRLHPPKPTIGVRATRPDETWHIDVTVLKLLDGKRGLLACGHRQLFQENPRLDIGHTPDRDVLRHGCRPAH